MDDREKKQIIASRIAQELSDGDVVNLGIGLPTLVAHYVPPGIDVVFQSENGFLGLGPNPQPGEEDYDLTNAGGLPVTMLPGGAFFHSADSFAIIRGGHIDITVLGALEVDAEGNLANWMVPGKLVPGMGGAMDLVVGAKKVIIGTLHLTKKGEPKLLRRCTLPLTAAGEVDQVVTEIGVFAVSGGEMVLTEKNPEYTVEQVRAATAAPLRIAADLKTMPLVP